MLKYLRKSNNSVFGLCQQPSKVECMYLSFKNLKVSSKKVKAQMFLEVKLDEDRCRWSNCNIDLKKQK